MIIDFHTHAFPEALAERAMSVLLAETDDVTAYHDGRLSSLLASMDRAGIDKAVICSIATRPEQFEKILGWSKAIADERVIPFPSVHPRDEHHEKRIREIAEAGFKGVKLHPYYQDFYLDEPAMDPIYASLCEHDLILVCHTGFDIAFPRVRRCDPVRITAVVDRFPDLKFVATHLGAWSDWEQVRACLLGKPIYMEISYSLGELPREEAQAMLREHPAEFILFGTDTPWQDQAETLRMLRELQLGEAREQAILSANALRLLG